MRLYKIFFVLFLTVATTTVCAEIDKKERKSDVLLFGKYQTILETDDSSYLTINEDGSFILETGWLDYDDKGNPFREEEVQKGTWKIDRKNVITLSNKNGKTLLKYYPRKLFTFGENICGYDTAFKVIKIGGSHKILGDHTLWKTSLDGLLEKYRDKKCEHNEKKDKKH